MTLTVDRPFTAPACPSDRPCRALTMPNLHPCGHAAVVRVAIRCADGHEGRIELCDVCLVRTALHLATCGVGECQQHADIVDSHRFAR